MWTRRMAEPRRRLDSGTAPSRGSFKPGTRAYAVQARPACNDAPLLGAPQLANPAFRGVRLGLWVALHRGGRADQSPINADRPKSLTRRLSTPGSTRARCDPAALTAAAAVGCVMAR